MTKEQRQPAKKWYKRKSNRFDRFALVCLVCLVCAGAYIAWAATQGTDKYPPRANQYQTTKDLVQKAVTAYAENHSGTLPTLNGTYTNADCSQCEILNISALLVKDGGMLRVAPDGLNLSTSGNDNCGGNASLGCRNGSSYIWIVDSKETVYSYCTGTGCITNNSDYQGVWP